MDKTAISAARYQAATEETATCAGTALDSMPLDHLTHSHAEYRGRLKGRVRDAARLDLGHEVVQDGVLVVEDAEG
eukprot:CAMPEP_0115462622 /NCGR_PEP_ID=MMETSP0271-20121206/47916_1 /TAXON_ID=71861 /ORGANISM="Scrippsiella trochoidea, Strain CCMP3099" /LENGTH=74 /DNA_ID=CAMNT_0002889409 /DNA_START=113 /DNA_END=335 /DNA_ORIENTATION=+